MNKIISNIVTFLVAIVGILGGGYWAFKSGWDMEPIILIIVSFIEILGFILSKLFSAKESPTNATALTSKSYTQNIYNKGGVKKQINIQKNKGNIKM